MMCTQNKYYNTYDPPQPPAINEAHLPAPKHDNATCLAVKTAEVPMCPDPCFEKEKAQYTSQKFIF